MLRYAAAMLIVAILIYYYCLRHYYYAFRVMTCHVIIATSLLRHADAIDFRRFDAFADSFAATLPPLAATPLPPIALLSPYAAAAARHCHADFRWHYLALDFRAFSPCCCHAAFDYAAMIRYAIRLQCYILANTQYLSPCRRLRYGATADYITPYYYAFHADIYAMLDYCADFATCR